MHIKKIENPLEFQEKLEVAVVFQRGAKFLERLDANTREKFGDPSSN
jgi:hypothetical protein